MILQNAGSRCAPASRIVCDRTLETDMKRFWITWLMTLAGGLALLAPALPASASARGVKDNAEFFSADGKARAGSIIDDIFRKHHNKEVLVETFTDTGGAAYEQFRDQ